MKMLSDETTTTETTLKPVAKPATANNTSNSSAVKPTPQHRLPLWLAIICTVAVGLVGGVIVGALLAMIR